MSKPSKFTNKPVGGRYGMKGKPQNAASTYQAVGGKKSHKAIKK